MKNITIKNKPYIQLIISFLIPAGLMLIGFKYWYLLLIFTILWLYMFIKTPNTRLMEFKDNHIILYEKESDNVVADICFDNIICWNTDNNMNGNVVIIYNIDDKQEILTVNSPNSIQVTWALNKYLKSKNYKFTRFNAPYENVGKSIFRNGK